MEREPLAERIKDAIPLQNHWEGVVNWLLSKSELFALKYRYSLTARLLDRAFDIEEKIIQARFSREKLALLQQIQMDLEISGTFLRHCHRLKLLSADAYEYICNKLAEAGKMTTGWRKYQEEKERRATADV